MYKPLSIFLGLRYVASRHGNGFSSFISASSTIGIALGVMVLIVVTSTMNGFEKELSQRLLSLVPHGELISVNEPIDDWRVKVAAVKGNGKINTAAPIIKFTGMAQKGKELKGVEVRGVEPSLEAKVSAITSFIDSGSWADLAKPNTVVIGSGVAEKLEVKVGDKMQLLLPKPSTLEEKSNQVAQRFPALIKRNVIVVGIFKFGGMIDDGLIYTSHQHAQEILELTNEQTQGIRIAIDNVFQAPIVIREVARSFDHHVYIHDWTRTQGHVFNDIQLVRMVMFIVLVLVIAVASFNIVSTLIMAVNEKKSDIAILKTMGASSFVIMATFMLQGMVNGILGCLIGALLGIYLSLNLTEILQTVESVFGFEILSGDVYFIDFIPTLLNSQDVYITVTLALILSLCATLYPAWRATKVEPAQVLGQI